MKEAVYCRFLLGSRKDIDKVWTRINNREVVINISLQVCDG